MDSRAGGGYPAHVHAMSPQLTLQGAVAHVDMPVEVGPTLYLPHSQRYDLGYLAYWLPGFPGLLRGQPRPVAAHRRRSRVVQPGVVPRRRYECSSDIQRMANLLQVNSAFGRAMESVDRARIVEAIHPALAALVASGWGEEAVANVVAASAEGYPFPSNLDRAQPVDGMAPPSQAEVVAAALAEGLPTE